MNRTKKKDAIRRKQLEELFGADSTERRSNVMGIVTGNKGVDFDLSLMTTGKYGNRRRVPMHLIRKAVEA
jgi:hypothetical protein